MENYRSKSTREGRLQYGDSFYGDRAASAAPAPAPASMHELRSYSTSYVKPPAHMDFNNNKEVKMKKSKSRVATTTKSWSFNDPELQRKKRVVSYKAYAVEGKMKGSIRKSFKWIKDVVVHGFW